MDNMITTLKKLRILNGISQSEFAQKMGYYDNTTISKYERGVMTPSLSVFQELVNLLGYELAIVPVGMSDMALEISEGKFKIDGSVSKEPLGYVEILKSMKLIRKQRGISQQEFADSLGVGNKTMISRYENGSINPTIDRMNEMLGILGYELAVVRCGYIDFARTVCEQKKKLDEENNQQTK